MDDRKRRRERRKAIASQRAAELQRQTGVNVARKAAPSAPVRSVTKMEPARPVVSVIRDVIKPQRLPAAAMPRSITSKIEPARTISPSAARLNRAPAKPRPVLPSPTPRPALSVPGPGRVNLSALKQSFSARTLPKATPALNTPAKPLAPRPKPLQPSPLASPVSDPPRKDRLTNCKERPKSNRRSGGSGSGRSFIPWCG